VGGDLVFIEPKTKLPPEGARTLNEEGKRKEKEEKKKRGKSRDKEQS
jgi:hypothetical protein